MPATVPRTVADGMTILGLPGKIGNANTINPVLWYGVFIILSIDACHCEPVTDVTGVAIRSIYRP